MTIRIFQHHWQLPLALLALTEIAIFVGALHLAFAVRFDAPLFHQELVSGPVLPRAVLFAGVMFVTMAAMGLYNARQRSQLIGRLARIAVGVVGGALATVVILYFLPHLYFGRGVLVVAVLCSFAGIAVVRTFFDRVLDQERFKRRVLVYGAGKQSSSLQMLRRRADRRGFFVVGYVRSAGDDPAITQELMLPEGRTLAQHCDALEVDEVVVAMDDRRRSFPMEELLECRLNGVEITDLATFLERETGKVRLDVLNPSWMIFSHGFRRGRVHSVLERGFDIVASLVLLAVAWPFMLLGALAIKIEDGLGASIFYGQVRVGQHGKPFRLLKLRSMKENAEADGQARWAATNDARVTRVGAFIRVTRIDELPQILNVLKGEMSFVGPRPERPEFVSQFIERIPYYRERHVIKPGITGWAQLCYPYGASDKDATEKLQYDLYYVKNHSLLFYLAVLVQTVEVILWGKGAR